MKKSIIFLLAITLSTSGHVNAQETGSKPKTTFALKGGINMNRFTGTNSKGEKISNDFVEGAHFGFNVEIPLFPGFYLQPGLQFVSKGSKNSPSEYTTATVTTYYAEMPLYLVAKPRIGKGFLIIGAGADISYGIGGTYKLKDDLFFQNNVNGHVKFEKEVNPNTASNNNLYLKPMDISVGFLIGYQFGHHFFIETKIQQGVSNILPDFYDATAKNAGFNLSIGCRF